MSIRAIAAPGSSNPLRPKKEVSPSSIELSRIAREAIHRESDSESDTESVNSSIAVYGGAGEDAPLQGPKPRPTSFDRKVDRAVVRILRREKKAQQEAAGHAETPAKIHALANEILAGWQSESAGITKPTTPESTRTISPAHPEGSPECK